MYKGVNLPVGGGNVVVVVVVVVGGVGVVGQAVVMLFMICVTMSEEFN